MFVVLDIDDPELDADLFQQFLPAR